MNGNCLDIGTIQAFLDGETRPEAALKISEHIADCDACAILLAQSEEESSQVFSVLDRELNSLVPTQRLWNRINESIAVEKSRASFWQRFMTFVSASLANPSLVTAAGILLVVGMFAAVWSLRPSVSLTAADVANYSTPDTTPAVSNRDLVRVSDPTSVVPPDKEDKVKETNFSPNEIKRLVTTANHKEYGPKTVRSEYASAAYLPGEESYIKTIADLQQTSNSPNRGDVRPSAQIAYQRDMAVVDDAINKMKQVVRKNPRNQAARQVLYASYQDKIDLLNSAAQREELMASLK